jgi:putative heme-binding domain-containing protein
VKSLLLFCLAVCCFAAAPAVSSTSPLAPLVRLLTETEDVDVQLDVLRGIYEGLQGRRVAAPAGWAEVHRKLSASPSAAVREKLLQVSVLLGEPQALAELRRVAADRSASESARRAALQTLIDRRSDDLVPLLRDLLGDRAVRGTAVRGLAAYADASIPPAILHHYSSFAEGDKVAAVATLTARPDWALALLDAMEAGTVPRRDLSAFSARQLHALQNSRLTERLKKVWGTLRPPDRDRTAQLARYKALVTPEHLKKADRSQGRAVFRRTCASCHTLFDDGARIGPDLTGSQRSNPDYILLKVLDPNAVVARDYQMTVVTTTAGRTISGLVKEEDERTLTMQTPTEVVRIAKKEIDEKQKSSLSLMPEGQLTMLSDSDVRDLIAYLAGATQVPLPR